MHILCCKQNRQKQYNHPPFNWLSKKSFLIVFPRLPEFRVSGYWSGHLREAQRGCPGHTIIRWWGGCYSVVCCLCSPHRPIMLDHGGYQTLRFWSILHIHNCLVVYLSVEVGRLLHLPAHKMPPVTPLDDDRRHLLEFAPQCGGDGLVGNFGRVGHHELLLHLLFQGIHFPRLSQYALCEGKQNIQAVDSVPTDHREVHGDQVDFVGLWDTQRFRQSVSKVRQHGELNELRGLWVKLLPNLVKHFKVILAQGLCALLCGNTEVLQNDSYIHIYHNEERNDNVTDKESYAHRGVAAVSSGVGACVDEVEVTLIWGAGHYRAEQVVPACRGADLEKADHTIPKGLEVKHIIDSILFLHIGKVCHAKDCIDEHDKEK